MDIWSTKALKNCIVKLELASMNSNKVIKSMVEGVNEGVNEWIDLLKRIVVVNAKREAPISRKRQDMDLSGHLSRSVFWFAENTTTYNLL